MAERCATCTALISTKRPGVPGAVYCLGCLRKRAAVSRLQSLERRVVVERETPGLPPVVVPPRRGPTRR